MEATAKKPGSPFHGSIKFLSSKVWILKLKNVLKDDVKKRCANTFCSWAVSKSPRVAPELVALVPRFKGQMQHKSEDPQRLQSNKLPQTT